MKIGCSSWSFHRAFGERGLDQFGFAELAVELGLDGIELLTSTFPSVGVRYLHELDTRLARLPVEISAVSVSNDFAHPDAAERRRQCEDVIQWTRICRDIGVGIIRIFTGHVGEGADAAEAKARVYACCEQVLGAAERTGVTLAVENHGNLLSTPEELAALVMHFGSPSLQLNPDPTNFLARHWEKPEPERETLYSSLARVARFAVHSHLKLRDFDPAGRPTNVDVPRLITIYRKTCYDGYLSIEYFGESDATDAVRKAVTYLRGLLGN